MSIFLEILVGLDTLVKVKHKMDVQTILMVITMIFLMEKKLVLIMFRGEFMTEIMVPLKFLLKDYLMFILPLVVFVEIIPMLQAEE